MASGPFRSQYMPDTEHPSAGPQPTISILIAARNEEAFVLDCLRTIARLNYPAGTVEVLVGNDQSADRTGPLVAAFAVNHPNVCLVDIGGSRAGLRGKANVLAQLAHRARGRYLLFTDADTRVPPGWTTQMSRAFTGNVGVVTGVTLPAGSRLFHKLQTIDWLYNLTLTHLLSLLGQPVTAMGNNMAVSREAYDAVGGYEALPFSVVEDYGLFRAVVGRGFGFQNLLDESVLAITRPVDTLRAFLHQRKRWMRGTADLPGWIVAALYGQYLAGPLLLLLGWFSPTLAIVLYGTKLLMQTLIISFGMARLRQTNLWPGALLFEPYQILMGPLAVVFYWLPTRIEWKGRKYE